LTKALYKGAIYIQLPVHKTTEFEVCVIVKKEMAMGQPPIPSSTPNLLHKCVILFIKQTNREKPEHIPPSFLASSNELPETNALGSFDIDIYIMVPYRSMHNAMERYIKMDS